MMKESNEFWDLTGRYLDGDITETDAARLAQLLQGDLALQQAFDAAQDAWNRTAALKDDYDPQLLERTLDKIDAQVAAIVELPPYAATDQPMISMVETKPVTRFRWKPWAVAAVLLPLAGLLIYWFIQQQSAAYTAVTWQHMEVPAGQQRKLVLPDSSIVYVNAGSRIDYPLAFTDSIREVRITGEAFFDITPQAAQPFVVRSGELSTRVLGTSFNIRAYENEQTQLITVASGKVQVSAENRNTAIVLPDQQLTYHTQDKAISTVAQAFEPANWMRHRMYFNNISFKDLAAEMSRRYAKTFVFTTPELESCHYRVIFNNLPLPELLEQLSITNGFSYTFRGDTVLLKGAGCR